MVLKAVLFCIAFSSILSACSSQELYNAGKTNREARCNEYVGHEREQCLQDINQKNYDIYEKERQQVIKGEVDEK
jgi:hypothetical protein